jgi:hypothetical protein
VLTSNAGVALSKGPNRVGVSVPSPEEGKRSSFRNVVIPSIYNSGRWTKSRNPLILRDKDRHYSLFKRERTKLDDAVKNIKE